ncbi:armadillo repeat-containing protein 4 [Heracleum sosnowskyi]|uniref:Armadillo repeat-containing protein 4 n=1 Tax=Heracleum sosnowskyi TaxID=360622 RepID=A0AAD8H787_9APIA|nr:armadillo repeat-containing protein 4 [Heracleum sosnowskyi]
MDQSGSEGKQPESSTRWEKAFNLYQEVILGHDVALSVQATIKLARLSNHAPESIIVQTVPILVSLLCSSSITESTSMLAACAYCLSSIACQGDGRLAAIIAQTGATKYILSVLPHTEGQVQKILLKCLRNVVAFGDADQMIFYGDEGLEVILGMLKSCFDGLRKFLLEILSTLALSREARRVIYSLGCVNFIVESARQGRMISRTRAAQAIGLLGLVQRARRMLVDLGAIQVLTELLRDGDTSAKLVSSNALGVISSHANFIRLVAEAGTIPLYSDLLQGPELMGKEIAEDVFCILAVDEPNALTIAEHLVRILGGNNSEAKAAAADVLWNLSSYKHSFSVIQRSGAIPLLVEILSSGDTGDVKERVSGVIAQLSYNRTDRMALANAGVIPLLTNILQDGSDELIDNAAEALVNFSEDPLLRPRIADAVNVPSFQNMQNRLIQIRASDAHIADLEIDDD